MIPPRKAIKAETANLSRFNPLAEVEAIGGVRVFDVGQGDCLAILDEPLQPVLWIDYGGRERNPFGEGEEKAPAIEARIPVRSQGLLMLSHWDEDHWCSAKAGLSARQAHWLVPRQLTSPRAVRFSAELERIRCIPESATSKAVTFKTRNGDTVCWEKLRPFAPDAAKENCNDSGVAFSVTSQARNEVIFLPGDAPFQKPRHYKDLAQRKLRMRGLIAFHHGAGTHWTKATQQFLEQWRNDSAEQWLVFSCSRPNAFNHPDEQQYEQFLPNAKRVATADARNAECSAIDVLFS